MLLFSVGVDFRRECVIDFSIALSFRTLCWTQAALLADLQSSHLTILWKRKSSRLQVH